ncbi:inner membrane-spanning protein YciB [Paracoccus aerodenitrificans]|uniref:inner membrane-spanning protein YciB n=1 Tax=Paracoccus aerodenitrificans TaxID=3017781 RepID=UPI0022F00F37|nr:inner membrane-spanning protein YciB [Paracoccus aerodenitrificans]WBU63154.1 septation protein IspZ [Paracoccus aerodenitrificans]
MKQIKPGLKIALEYGPLIAFFAVYMLMRNRPVTIGSTEYEGFVLATMVFVPVLALSMLALWRLTGKLSAMQLMTLILVVVFGGLTIWLNDDRFFKMKPTLIYAIFAGLLGLGLMLKRNWLELVLGEALPMQHEGWMKLTRRMVLLFIGLAVANEFVWRTMSDTAWVNFKTFGLPVIMFVFFMGNAGLFNRYALEKED